ncbi:MAG TPA: hypothetical protein V6C65_03375, partial [Allocoleopsis sp.]
ESALTPSVQPMALHSTPSFVASPGLDPEQLTAPEQPIDCSDLIAAIAIHLRRLQWTREKVGTCLYQQFGKSHQSRLSEQELVQWLVWLEKQQATPFLGSQPD